MLLNFFYENLDIPKQRLHFNEFMISFHDFSHTSKENEKNNIIKDICKKNKQTISILCFDEFQITNIVDAGGNIAPAPR